MRLAVHDYINQLLQTVVMKKVKNKILSYKLLFTSGRYVYGDSCLHDGVSRV